MTDTSVNDSKDSKEGEEGASHLDAGSGRGGETIAAAQTSKSTKTKFKMMDLSIDILDRVTKYCQYYPLSAVCRQLRFLAARNLKLVGMDDAVFESKDPVVKQQEQLLSNLLTQNHLIRLNSDKIIFQGVDNDINNLYLSRLDHNGNVDITYVIDWNHVIDFKPNKNKNKHRNKKKVVNKNKKCFQLLLNCDVYDSNILIYSTQNSTQLQWIKYDTTKAKGLQKRKVKIVGKGGVLGFDVNCGKSSLNEKQLLPFCVGIDEFDRACLLYYDRIDGVACICVRSLVFEGKHLKCGPVHKFVGLRHNFAISNIYGYLCLATTRNYFGSFIFCKQANINFMVCAQRGFAPKSNVHCALQFSKSAFAYYRAVPKSDNIVWAGINAAPEDASKQAIFVLKKHVNSSAQETLQVESIKIVSFAMAWFDGMKEKGVVKGV